MPYEVKKDRGVEAVGYSLAIGASCPFCGACKVPPYSVGGWHRGAKVRYHKCRICGGRFKSVQDAAGEHIK